MQLLISMDMFIHHHCYKWRCVKHGMEWIGLDWIGLDWIGMEWNGIDWSGAHFYFEIYFRNNSSPNHSLWKDSLASF